MDLDQSGCTQTQAGPQTIAPTTAYVACRPTRIQVSCNVDPRGIWTNRLLGYLEVVPQSDNTWQIRGFDFSPYGRISGTLQGTPPTLLIDARAASGALVTGQVSVELNRLTGHIVIGGAPVELEVTR
jgi:hypothetical protein